MSKKSLSSDIATLDKLQYETLKENQSEVVQKWVNDMSKKLGTEFEVPIAAQYNKAKEAELVDDINAFVAEKFLAEKSNPVSTFTSTVAARINAYKQSKQKNTKINSPKSPTSPT